MIITDKSCWVVVNSKDFPGKYRIASDGVVQIADGLDLSIAIQMCDEHRVVRILVDTLQERESTTIAVSRSPL